MKKNMQDFKIDIKSIDEIKSIMLTYGTVQEVEWSVRSGVGITSFSIEGYIANMGVYKISWNGEIEILAALFCVPSEEKSKLYFTDISELPDIVQFFKDTQGSFTNLKAIKDLESYILHEEAEIIVHATIVEIDQLLSYRLTAERGKLPTPISITLDKQDAPGELRMSYQVFDTDIPYVSHIKNKKRFNEEIQRIKNLIEENKKGETQSCQA